MTFLRPYRQRLTSRRYRFVSTSHKRKGGAVCASKLAAEGRMKKRKQQGNSKAAASQTSGRRINRLPEWVDPGSYITKGGRFRLKGIDYTRLRFKAFLRACGRCECGCGRRARFIEHRPHPEAGELAHLQHGARKSDELHRVRWLNWQCHERSHNCGGKPCPKKATV